jgi:hypothetical protein
MPWSPRYPHYRFWHIDLVSEAFAELTRMSVVRAQNRRGPRPRVRRWQRLRAGVDTPLWNALAAAVETQLRQRGAKARLARFLGVSRQRLHLLIVAKRAYPDAERALLLQLWLQGRRGQRDLRLHVPPGRAPSMSSPK